MVAKKSKANSIGLRSGLRNNRDLVFTASYYRNQEYSYPIYHRVQTLRCFCSGMVVAALAFFQSFPVWSILNPLDHEAI